MRFLWRIVLLATALGGCGGGSGDGGAADSTATTLQVERAENSWQSRLPCEGGAGDFCALRIYQVMVEAFIDGDGSRGFGDGYGPSHHRGDLQGVINALDYIKSLGVNALWLTPIFDTDAGGDRGDTFKLDATGYFAYDYFKVEPNFGNREILGELVRSAHEKGLYVILDGVFGHHKASGVATSPQGRRPAGGSNPVAYPGSLPFYQEVLEYWTTGLCLDGWRLDQAYQVPLEGWRELRATLADAVARNAANPECYVAGRQWGVLGYLVAEVWKDNVHIVTEAYGSDASPALPSAFDFMRRYALTQVLAVEESGKGGQPIATLIDGWNAHDGYPAHAQPNLMLGNHDLVRFGDLLQRGGLADPVDPAYWKRHKAAFSYMAAYSGPITFYYGEEIGDQVPGFAARVEGDCAARGLCDDHVARSSGKVEGLGGFLANASQADLREYLGQLMRVREANPALFRGRIRTLAAERNVLLILKEYRGEQVLYALNAGNRTMSLTLRQGLLANDPGQLTDLMSGEVIRSGDGAFEVDLPALSGRLLKVE